MARSRKSVDALIGAALAAPGDGDGDGPLAVAFSGGLDSTVLLHAAACRLGASRVLALHVHHGLQPQADAWVAHCAARAAALGVPFRALQAAGAPAPGESIEGWAREVRYALLLAAAREAGACALATAHHADDQAETLLLALGRGCGLDGLTGIAPRDRREGVILLRPLLELGRDALREHARMHGLDWVEDPSNADARVPRSALRMQGLPALESVLPGWAQGVPAALQALRDARAIVDERAAQDLAAAGASGASTLAALDRRMLAALPGARIDAVLRAWLGVLGETAPSRAKLAELRAQLVDGDCTSAEQRHGAHRLHRYRDLLWADRGLPPAVQQGLRTLRWSGEPALPIGDTGSLCFDAAPDGLEADWLRARTLQIGPVASSARLRPDAAGPRRTIKNLRQEAGVPPSLRAAFPGVLVDGRLLWAAPFGRDRDPDWPTAAPGIALRFEPAASSPARAWEALSAASSR
jgi:tRNA(Ile)-lysidine synthase